MSVPAHIIVVDDEAPVRKMVERYLAAEGFRVSAVADGRGFWSLHDQDPGDLVVLDVRLSGEDGLDIARRLRERSSLGIIMLSGKGDPVDRIVGLEVGADDYVTKPFELRELLARVRSVLRRAGRDATLATTETPATSRRARFAGWQLDLDTRDLTGPDGMSHVLAPRNFALLELLVTRSRRVQSRDAIMDAVFGRDHNPLDRTVDILVHQLRARLEDDPRKPAIIRTVRGAGYVLTTAVEIVEE